MRCTLADFSHVQFFSVIQKKYLTFITVILGNDLLAVQT